MGTELEPKGEPLRRAIRWISEQRTHDPKVSIKALVNEAGLRFDLAPLDQEYLWNTFVRHAACSPPKA